jgi:hypothetical protein
MSCKSNSNNTCCGGACMTKGSCNLLLWTDIKKSAISLGSILSALLLIKYVNLVSLFFHLSTFTLLGAALAEYSGKILTGTGFLTKFKPQEKGCVGNFADYYAPHFVTVLKKVELKTYALYTAANVENSIRAGIASFFLYKLTSTFSLWSLIFVLTILSFSVPLIYTKNKEIIDKNILKIVEILKEKFDEVLKITNEKLGPQFEKAKKIADPVWKTIESKLPVRTAGSTVASGTEVKSTATTTSSSTHEQSSIKKVSVATNEPTEVDFNKLGEDLKKQAQNATADAEIFTNEKNDIPPSS